jgi:hypothetical protein
MDIQTRSEETGLRTFSTLVNAFTHAKEDLTVWKISFEVPSGERVRLVRNTDQGDDLNTWFYEPLMG